MDRGLGTSEPLREFHVKQVAIRFEQVAFHYPTRLQMAALDDITLEIPSGKTVTLVDPSGAGKTTLFQILLRFYDVTGGCIRLNGQDIRQLSLLCAMNCTKKRHLATRPGYFFGQCAGKYPLWPSHCERCRSYTANVHKLSFLLSRSW